MYYSIKKTSNPLIKLCNDTMSSPSHIYTNVLCIDYKTYTKYENDITNLPLRHLIELCNEYQLSLYSFLFDIPCPTEDIAQKKLSSEETIAYAPLCISAIINRVKTLQNEFGVSNNVLCKKIGIAPNTYHHWLKDGDKNIHLCIKHLLSICNYFGKSIPFILYGYSISKNEQKIKEMCTLDVSFEQINLLNNYD